MGKTPLQHTYDAKVSAGALCVIFSATVQERYSLPGKTKQQKSDQKWKSQKGCMLLIQKSEGTGAK